MAKSNTNKTQPTSASVEKFLESVKDDRRREDAFAVLKLMKQVTKLEPVMWGESMVGFGTYHYKYATGREGDYFLTGFSPRVTNLTIYIMSGFKPYSELMEKMGKCKTSSSCLYIKKLEDIDLAVLKKLIKQSVAYMSKQQKSE